MQGSSSSLVPSSSSSMGHAQPPAGEFSVVSSGPFSIPTTTFPITDETPAIAAGGPTAADTDMSEAEGAGAPTSVHRPVCYPTLILTTSLHYIHQYYRVRPYECTLSSRLSHCMIGNFGIFGRGRPIRPLPRGKPPDTPDHPALSTSLLSFFGKPDAFTLAAIVGKASGTLLLNPR